MVAIRVIVCDECQEIGHPVATYRISGGGRTVSVTLCEEDAKPLLRWLKGRSRRTQFRSRITTVEEIEKLKKKS